ncbi:tRNA preQ1(34) S-adenosylmethionine ribosyltransferase-isomerase QueA [Candidatus Peregrinibacteria bacterium]|nr:tRNA preQ1(34) S-adenosylmethionine ribosyltransferase-isomerase QueA [Candidatus Peregrinibacteria bacterium]
MRVSDFDFFLPEKLIAHDPVSPRDYCRLMVLDRDNRQIKHQHFFDLVRILQPGDVLVMNDSRVIPARIVFENVGKQIEIFLLRQVYDNVWTAIGKPGKAMRVGAILTIDEELSVAVVSIDEHGVRTLRFSLSGKKLMDKIYSLGATPLPPYITQSVSKPEEYQTVYAKKEGSVAAPTAGLHFTKRLLSQLQQKGVDVVFVTLHVGLGTFLPLKTQNVHEHHMHHEAFYLSPENAVTLQKAKDSKKRIIAVGTTSVRVLEATCKNGVFESGFGETNIYIYPGYKWKCVNGLITNFHLPQSTLLLLTSSFGGKDFVMKAYAEAKNRNYRFYSFGDAMLIL